MLSYDKTTDMNYLIGLVAATNWTATRWQALSNFSVGFSTARKPVAANEQTHF
jgi:hypothetical protein